MRRNCVFVFPPPVGLDGQEEGTKQRLGAQGTRSRAEIQGEGEEGRASEILHKKIAAIGHYAALSSYIFETVTTGDVLARRVWVDNE